LDAKATAEEKAATESLISRIQEIQNTEGEELSGVQIIVHFLRIRVQPLQTRKNPLWLYSGADDYGILSEDLPLKDWEKLVRRFTSLSKNSEVPSSCRVEPFSGVHALPAVSIFLRVLLLLSNCNWFFFGSNGFCRIVSLFLPAGPPNSFFPSSTT
jgi:hypothetical protein